MIMCLGFIGLFGSIVSGIQVLIVEREQLSNQIGVIGSVFALVPLAGYVVAMFTFYSLFPVLVARTSATVLNLRYVHTAQLLDRAGVHLLLTCSINCSAQLVELRLLHAPRWPCALQLLGADCEPYGSH